MDERPPTPATPDTGELAPVPRVMRRASRFSREFMATLIALVTTAFGVVVALAWNEALSTWLKELSKVYRITGLFTYAIIVTIAAVLTVMFLGRLASRIGGEPLEFKYPAPKKD